MRVVSVWPAENGWEVRSDAIENDQVFSSGSKAETAARRLAVALAYAGEDVSVHVHLRDGALAGTRMVWAEDPRRGGQGWDAQSGTVVEFSGDNHSRTADAV